MAKITRNLTQAQLKKYKKTYDSNPANATIEAAISGVGIDKASMDLEALKKHTFVFGTECLQGEPTTQKKSGRCWYFAALNTLRQIVMEKLNVENFEFSETHLYFYDKMEKANTFLERIISTIDKPTDDPEMRLLLMGEATYDGGFWEYFKPLCLKYGLVPKAEGPETFHSEESYMFTKQMDYRLLRTAVNMRKAYKAGKSKEEIRQMKDDVLYEVYNIAVKCLGRPAEKFSFSYRDKDKKHHRIEDITPVEFFEKYIGKEELDKRIVVCSDPRDKYPHGKRLSLKWARSIFESDPAGGLNIPMEDLAKAALASVKDGVPCWFACDVGKDIDRKKGILDTKLFNYDKTLTPIGEFLKADRFEYGYSGATHAMNLTGVELDLKGNPVNWKVENSWGDDLGKKGTFSMSHEWFMEYTYELIIDKKYIDKKWLKGLKEDAIEISEWDVLARAINL